MNSIEERVDLLTRLALAGTEEERHLILERLEKVAYTHRDCSETTKVSPQLAVEDILLELGVPCNLSGYEFIVECVCELIKDSALRGKVTSALYPKIARIRNTTAAAVERNVRHAIEVVWDRGDVEALHKYFGHTVLRTTGKPTNSQFLWQLCTILKRRGVVYEMD